MISRKTSIITATLYEELFSDEFQIKEITRGLHNPCIKIKDFFFERGFDVDFLNTIDSFYNKQKFKDFIQNLQFSEKGQKYLFQMIESLFQYYPSSKLEDYSYLQHTKSQIDKLILQLESDGYCYKNGRVIPIENSVINQQTEQTYLEILIDSLSLSDSKTIKHHLNLSEEHYANSKWGDCISNSRMALEAILQQVADAIHIKKNGTNLSQNIYTRPIEVRKYLESENFFDTKETKTISEVYGLLSNTGSHPNMSKKDKARLMRNLALSLSQYTLITYEGLLKKNP